MLNVWLQRLNTGLTVWSSNPGGGKNFLVTTLVQTWGSTQPPLQWVTGLFPGVKR